MKILLSTVALVFVLLPSFTVAKYRFADFRAKPPTHIKEAALLAPRGLSPGQIKAAYHLPATGGSGTIAIIGAYDNATIENDLSVFSAQYKLPACTSANGCFEKHKVGTVGKHDSGWSLETAMDIEWAHAIAPTAKLLLVEAQTPAGKYLLDAIDYARARPEVVAVSMSWGGPEYPEAESMESHFVNKGKSGPAFFASSGDNGTGVSWPAVSAHVVAVGGTTLTLDDKGTVTKETAWSGSGGGVSQYIVAPAAQKDYAIARASGMRALPDVAYDADPASGVAVYSESGPQKVTKKNGKGGWYTLGGTSAGAPQWAGIYALDHSATLDALYGDKAKGTDYFRDITSGSNGDCGYECKAHKHYDFVTGLGSPLTAKF